MSVFTLLQAKHLASGLSFWLLSCLALVFSAFKELGYDDQLSLMYVSFLLFSFFLSLFLCFAL